MERTPERAMARFIIRHRRPSLWRLAIPGLLALVLGASAISSGGVAEWPMLMVLVLGAILMPFIVFGMMSQRMPDQWMEVRPRSIVVPATSLSAEALEIPVSQIRSIYARLTPDGSVWIETSFRTFTFPLRVFESPASAALLVDRVRERIRELPDGEERIAIIDRDGRIAERALATKHAATIGAVTLFTAAGLLLYLAEAQRSTFGLVRFGANVDFLVREGELHRLAASLFLHAGPVHLAFVIFGVAAAGAVVERLLGTVGALAIMLAAGLAGSLAMHAGDGFLAVGATPIVFGLMGAAAFITQQYKKRIPVLLRPTLGLWILIGTFTIPVAIVPEVDFSANLGGLLAGVIVGALLAGGDDGFPLRGLRPRWAVALVLLLGAGYVHSLVTAAVAWNEHRRGTDARVIDRALELDRMTHVGLNKLAWELAIDPAATAKELSLAEKAAERAVERSPETDSISIEDTLATVYHRQGRHAEAVALEKQVFERAAEPVFASQLARFLRAQAATSTATYALAAELAGGEAKIELSEPLPRDAAVYLVAVEGGELRGLVTLPLKAGETRASVAVKDAGWTEGVELSVASVDRDRSVRAGAWAISEDAPELP
jgi:membrane associated rhomboid family serine protease